MIDLGISYKNLKEKLEKISFSPSSINKIFISHEHIDHVKGLVVFLKNNSHVTLYINEMSFNAINSKKQELEQFREQVVFINDGDIIKHNNVEIMNVQGSHDSQMCFAFEIKTPNFTMFHATDIGNLSMKIRKHIKNANFLLLESNYDFEMLRKNTSYPMKTIQRICSNVGHLSNDDATKMLSKLDTNVTKYVCLAHLSENNNTYDKVKMQNEHIKLNKFILPKDEVLNIKFEEDLND